MHYIMFNTSLLSLAIPRVEVTNILQNNLMLLMCVDTEAVKSSSPYISGNTI